METLRFLTPEDVRAVAEAHGTPTYVYDRATLDATGGAREGVSERVRIDRALRDEGEPERGDPADV